MENKRVVPIWVSVVLLVMCAATLALNVFGITKRYGPIFDISYIIQIVTILFVIFYCFLGYKKSSAALYKAFLAARIISVAWGLYIVCKYAQVFTIVGSVIVLICLLLLASIKNLGKKYSMILALLMIVATSANFFYFFAVSGTLNGGHITGVLLSIVFLIMVYAKYQDKAARGTK